MEHSMEHSLATKCWNPFPICPRPTQSPHRPTVPQSLAAPPPKAGHILVFRHSMSQNGTATIDGFAHGRHRHILMAYIVMAPHDRWLCPRPTSRPAAAASARAAMPRRVGASTGTLDGGTTASYAAAPTDRLQSHLLSTSLKGLKSVGKMARCSGYGGEVVARRYGAAGDRWMGRGLLTCLCRIGAVSNLQCPVFIFRRFSNERFPTF